VWVQIGATMAQMVKLVKEVYLRLRERGAGPKLEPTEEERQVNDAEYRERRMMLRKRRIAAKKAKLAGLHVSLEQGQLLKSLTKLESTESDECQKPFPYSSLITLPLQGIRRLFLFVSSLGELLTVLTQNISRRRIRPCTALSLGKSRLPL
jgi:hypothetical protein